MKGSEFAQTYSSKGPAAWESAALHAADTGGALEWPLVPVTYTENGKSITIRAASDYFSVGDPGDFLRLPLSPITAQRIANMSGCLLPTPKLALQIWRAAQVKLTPQPMQPNKFADMNQFVEHNALVERQLQGAGSGSQLKAGHKKDVVIGNLYKPGKVLIYGWFKPDAPLSGKDQYPSMAAPWRIQPYSNIHGEFYFDYSHGIRFIHPKATVDGVEVDLTSALLDPKFSYLFSDEGPLKSARYPTPGSPRPNAVASLLTPNEPGYTAYGTRLLANRIVT